jgi:1,2-diacylglycerol 3-beta-glucosyltransferase
MFLLVFHLPVASALGLLVFASWVTGLTEPFNETHAFIFWTLLFLGPLLELGGGMLIARAPRRVAPSLVFFVPIFFVSIALCTKAWLDSIRGRPYVWRKTPRAMGAALQVVR